MEVENYQAARALEQIVAVGEQRLEQIQQALSDIAQTQLSLQAVDADEPQSELNVKDEVNQMETT